MSEGAGSGPLRVLVADPTATVPFYDCHLLEALREVPGLDVVAWLGRPEREPSALSSVQDLIPAWVDPPTSDRGWRGIRLGRLGKAAMHLANWRRLRRAVSRDPVDVVHFQWLPMLRPLSIDLRQLRGLRRRGVRTVHTAHNILPHDTGTRWLRAYRELYQEVDALVVHTDPAAVTLRTRFSVPTDKVHVIPHGPLFEGASILPQAEARRRLELGPGPLLLSLGFVAPYKGLDHALAVLQQVRRDVPARLVVAGTPMKGYARELRDRAAALGVAEAVDFRFRWVPTGQVPVYHAAADVTLLPYRSITQSGALMTVIGLGVPFVASDLPGFRDVVGPSHAAAVLQPPSDVEGWAHAVRAALTEPETTRGRALAIRDAVSTSMGWPVIAHRTAAVYHEVAGRGRSTAMP